MTRHSVLPPAGASMIDQRRDANLVVRPPVTDAQRTAWRWKMHWSRTDWILDLLRDIDGERRQLAAGPQASQQTTWLLKYRSQFRRLEGLDLEPAVGWYLASCDDSMVPMGLWMLSRRATRFYLAGMPEYAASSHPTVVRILARTFARREAWEHLQQLAETHPDSEAATWYAKSRERSEPFAVRMNHWRRNVTAQPLATDPPSRALWFRDWPWALSPPKSAAAIRRVLRRINRLVRLGQ